MTRVAGAAPRHDLRGDPDGARRPADQPAGEAAELGVPAAGVRDPAAAQRRSGAGLPAHVVQGDLPVPEAHRPAAARTEAGRVRLLLTGVGGLRRASTARPGCRSWRTSAARSTRTLSNACSSCRTRRCSRASTRANGCDPADAARQAGRPGHHRLAGRQVDRAGRAGQCADPARRRALRPDPGAEPGRGRPRRGCGRDRAADVRVVGRHARPAGSDDLPRREGQLDRRAGDPPGGAHDGAVRTGAHARSSSRCPGCCPITTALRST